jgi:adenosylcobinamide kinase/adenosylcobinamide-phosphate guanylyltransferase
MDPARAGSLTLVLGGARSGKSRHAERLVLASGLTPVYVATAQALDAEMAARIAAHRARRGAAWRTIEEPLELARALERECAEPRAVLVDCLTLWLTNLMVAGRPVRAEMARLVELLPSLPGTLVLVTPWRAPSSITPAACTRGLPSRPMAWFSWPPACPLT